MGNELDAARAFGASALNVHIGSHKGSGPEAGIERVGGRSPGSSTRRPADGATRGWCWRTRPARAVASA